MALFRRHTDEVFSTLQQVQRRLSQTQNHDGGGGVSQAPSNAVGSVSRTDGQPPRVNTAMPEVTTLGSTRTVRPVDDQPQSQSPAEAKPSAEQQRRFRLQKGDSNVPSHVRRSDEWVRSEPVEPEPQVAAGSEPRRRGVLVGPEVMAFLLVVWVCTVVLAYMIRGSVTDPRLDPGLGDQYHADGDDDASAVIGDGSPQGAAEPQGDSLLVLMSSRQVDARKEETYAIDARKLNALMRQEKNAQKGYKPWFGVRYPQNGGIQLVYGKVASDTFGVLGPEESPISKRLFEVFKAKRYQDAYWFTLTR